MGRPHGLDGAFVVERPSQDPERFAVGAALLLDGEPVEVVLARRVGGGRIAIKLDRRAERGQTLAVRRADLPDLPEDAFYAADLVGLTVVGADGAAYGNVAEVLPGAANDNLLLDDGSLVPMIEDAIGSVDLAGRRIVLNPGFID